MMNYFIFKGINSKDKDIIINKMPSIIKPERKIDLIEVPGRNGTLHIDEEAYKTIVIQIECTLLKRENLRDIMAWLDGEGELILSNEPDKFYKATIINQIDYSGIVNIFHTFPLQIELQPFLYSNEMFIKKYNNLAKFNFNISDATAKMRPIIHLTGNGKINLNINNEGIIINLDENDYIEINCDLQIAYKENQSANNKILGDLNKINLIPGINKFDIIGNYQQIEIKYRKTYL